MPHLSLVLEIHGDELHVPSKKNPSKERHCTGHLQCHQDLKLAFMANAFMA